MKDIEGAAVVLNLGCRKIQGQHNFIFRDTEIKGLLNGLRLYAKLPENIDHLVGIPRIPAETVPFGKQHHR
ncbi:hypothetical protein KJK34_03605 [Flavobacterium sp. D11R37]|nr:hypothetical protein [Flavobacterium coralii]MBY8961831.1 hypothetical protein [Flavobacterium coralii]